MTVFTLIILIIIIGDSHIASLKEKLLLASETNDDDDDSEIGFVYSIGNLQGFSARLSKEYVNTIYINN